MPVKQNKQQTPIADADDFSAAEIDARVAQTLAHVEAIKQLWPGLRRLSAAERRESVGRSLGVMAPVLGLLFGVLAPEGQPAPAVAKAFDVLGAQDHGDDPDRFEAALLARRLHRARAEQKVQEALGGLARHFGDDVIHVGELVVGPGLLALGLAKNLAKARPEFASALAPVLDALRAMTKRARSRVAAGAEAPEGEDPKG